MCNTLDQIEKNWNEGTFITCEYLIVQFQIKENSTGHFILACNLFFAYTNICSESTSELLWLWNDKTWKWIWVKFTTICVFVKCVCLPYEMRWCIKEICTMLYSVLLLASRLACNLENMVLSLLMLLLAFASGRLLTT